MENSKQLRLMLGLKPERRSRWPGISSTHLAECREFELILALRLHSSVLVSLVWEVTQIT